MILLDSSDDFEKNEVLFVKTGVRVLELWLETFSEPKLPKCSFEAPHRKVKKSFEISQFYWIHLIILE